MKGYLKHNSTHGASTDPLASPEDMPKPNFASQPGCNFGPSKLLRQSNQSVLRKQFQVPGRGERVRGRGVNRFTPRRSLISYSMSNVWGVRLNPAQGYSKACEYWVGQSLVDYNTTMWKEKCSDFLSCYMADGESCLSHIITDDETLIHHFEPQT